MYRELIKKIMNGLQVFEQNFLNTTTAVFPIEARISQASVSLDFCIQVKYTILSIQIYCKNNEIFKKRSAIIRRKINLKTEAY